MKRHIPAIERNRGLLSDVLREVLPSEGTLLEVDSIPGKLSTFSGLRYFFPGLTLQFASADPEVLADIETRRVQEGHANILPSPLLDPSSDTWPVTHADAILCVYMIDRAPWEACQGLMRGAGRVLRPGGPLVLYGPFLVEGVETPRNRTLDESLRSRDLSHGVRELEAVIEEAARHGLQCERVAENPMENFTVVFRREGLPPGRRG
ncbi:DUF938 domain-containing protein [Corallococcus aberystwythensis]|uniref:DUF938 domain-containing protein n=1 Tax=Corallococcus aberystwythensis TaxID=2316722 RepID=A0A3A8QXH7_9BACT|nr:DUF938 domain-containing protein [Corallococcus aberystwythensis]RKH71145.1 DUF938 domain-containing protein [Corallococcus aberystwythensis]